MHSATLSLPAVASIGSYGEKGFRFSGPLLALDGRQCQVRVRQRDIKTTALKNKTPENILTGENWGCKKKNTSPWRSSGCAPCAKDSENAFVETQKYKSALGRVARFAICRHLSVVVCSSTPTIHAGRADTGKRGQDSTMLASRDGRRWSFVCSRHISDSPVATRVVVSSKLGKLMTRWDEHRKRRAWKIENSPLTGERACFKLLGGSRRRTSETQASDSTTAAPQP